MNRGENKNKGQEQKEDPKKLLNMSPEEEIKKQQDDIEFSCAMICFSLIRFISDHMQDLSIPIVHQMMENNDIPCILVPLLELKPWIRKNHKGDVEKYEDQKWVKVPPSEINRIPKVEAQIWLTIYNMFLTSDANRKYEMTTFRKSNLLRLRKYMNEVLLD